MRICDLDSLEIGILGYGLEGTSVHRLLRRRGRPAGVHVLSDRELPDLAGASVHVADAALAALARLDLLVRSPGFPPHHPIRQAADARGLRQTTATNLFLGEIHRSGLPVAGITGSKGKSTTSTLTDRMLQTAGIASALVGNIGRPPLDELERIIAERMVAVMELSSYQCADLEDGNGPTIAAMLDLFPEHLDWHGDRATYYAAKALIFESQAPGGTAICNASSAGHLPATDLPNPIRLINTPDALHFSDGWFCDGPERLFPDTGMRLPGVHNRRNAVAALAIVSALGVAPETARPALIELAGLPYRLEDEGVHSGIRWFNDSLSTAPEAAAAALRALGESVHTLICGGYDRGYDVAPLIDALAESRVRELILLPDTGRRITGAAESRGLACRCVEVPTLAAAVEEARGATPQGGTCLFSPGAPSYNQFASFEERGKAFRGLIRSRA